MLAQPEESPSARRLKLRQLLDLLAQGFDNFSPQERDEALTYLQQIEASLTIEERDRVRALAQLCSKGASEAGGQAASSPLEEQAPSQAVRFDFETDESGTLVAIDGAPREALFGLNISAADPEGTGFCAKAAKAFTRKAGFRNAYLRVPGRGGASGHWCVSAVPFYDRRRDTFLGYRGTARRPAGDELSTMTSNGNPGGLFSSKMPADSMRQLVHEIRTPLNAIAGFAEMIDNQLLGPTADDYRHRARSIRAEVERLLSAVEDLDIAAEVDTKVPAVGGKSVDLTQIISRRAADGDNVVFPEPPPLPPVMMEADAADKIVAKMLTLACGLTGPGETVHIALSGPGDRRSQSVTFSRPVPLRGCTEAELLDPGFTPSGEFSTSPALGVGFTLRLIRNLLRANGGALIVHSDQFELCFPCTPAT